MAVYAQPGQSGSVIAYKARYDHWIGGKYVAPSSGQYFENVTPVLLGSGVTQIVR